MTAKIPRDGDRISVFGAPGSGKTTLAVRALVRDINRDGRTVLAFDPTGDINRYLIEGSAAKDTVDPDLVRVVASADEAIQLSRARSSLFGTSLRARVFVLLARNGMKAKAEQFRRSLNTDSTRGWVLFADEAELVFGNEGIDQEDALAGLKLVRNRQQRLYLVGQRPQWLSALARSNSTHVCVFRADSRKFVQHGTAEWGEAEDFELCHELEKFEYLYRGENDKPPYTIKHALEDGIPWR